MLGMMADPAAATSRTFYTSVARSTAAGNADDVEVWTWRLTLLHQRGQMVLRYPTAATCGATFHSGARWRSWNDVPFGYGRLRTAQQGPDSNLCFTLHTARDQLLSLGNSTTAGPYPASLMVTSRVPSSFDATVAARAVTSAAPSIPRYR